MFTLFAAIKLKRAIHHEINISVETSFIPEVSLPASGKFIFAYRIRIENDILVGLNPQDLMKDIPREIEEIEMKIKYVYEKYI